MKNLHGEIETDKDIGGGGIIANETKRVERGLNNDEIYALRRLVGERETDFILSVKERVLLTCNEDTPGLLELGRMVDLPENVTPARISAFLIREYGILLPPNSAAYATALMGRKIGGLCSRSLDRSADIENQGWFDFRGYYSENYRLQQSLYEVLRPVNMESHPPFIKVQEATNRYYRYFGANPNVTISEVLQRNLAPDEKTKPQDDARPYLPFRDYINDLLSLGFIDGAETICGAVDMGNDSQAGSLLFSLKVPVLEENEGKGRQYNIMVTLSPNSERVQMRKLGLR